MDFDFLSKITGVQIMEDATTWSEMEPKIVTHVDIKDGMRPNIEEFDKNLHPCILMLTTDCEGQNYERTITKGIKELRGLLKGERSASYRDLPLPTKLYGAYTKTLRIDNFPVRIVCSYDMYKAGYITTLDTYRPAKYEYML